MGSFASKDVGERSEEKTKKQKKEMMKELLEAQEQEGLIFKSKTKYSIFIKRNKDKEKEHSCGLELNNFEVNIGCAQSTKDSER